MEKDFGLFEQQAGWRVQGSPGPEELVSLAHDLIKFVDMIPDGLPAIDAYPKGGKGGHGIQVYQPLYESWLIISTWPDHGFIRVNLSSCKPFHPEAVASFLSKRVGPILMEWGNPL